MGEKGQQGMSKTKMANLRGGIKRERITRQESGGELPKEEERVKERVL